MAAILRTRSAIISLGTLPLALALIIALHLFEPAGLSVLGDKALRSLHGPGFAAIAIAVGWGLRSRATGWWRIGLALVICLAISLLAELSQVPGPRNAEIADLIVNGAGIVAGLGLVAALDPRLDLGGSLWTRRMLALVSMAALALILTPTVWLSAALSARNANLPVLLSFESALERELYSGMRTSPPARVPAPANWGNGGTMIGHGTAKGRWGTMLAMSPYPDWRDYEAVSFAVASAGAGPIDVGVTLRSSKENFYMRFTIDPDPRRVRIAFADVRAKRLDFDFSNVRTLAVSAAEPGEPYEVLFDDFRLEN